MRILFLHRQYPGPFRQLAAAFARAPENRVLFLSEQGRLREQLPRVRHITVARLRDQADVGLPDEAPAERAFLLSHRRAASMANAMLRLKSGGFEPDIVCTGGEGGAAFYVRDIFPNAFLTVYADWFVSPRRALEKMRSPVDFAPARTRNLFQTNLLADCDLSIAFSDWQKAQYPPCFAAAMHTLPQGVDTGYFSPAPGAVFRTPDCDLSGARELVTFCGRAGEPSRGLIRLLRALPALLAARPHCHALLLAQGLDDAALGELAQNTTPELDKERVHLLPSGLPETYRLLLRASSAHVYLTVPHSLSTGLFEAMSCGAPVLASDLPAVREVIRPGVNGFVSAAHSPEELAAALADLLARDPAELAGVRAAARQTIVENFSLQRQAPKHLELILSTRAARLTADS